MSRPCREIEELFGPRTTLSEAQQLSLEQHLQECEECRHLHAMSNRVGAAVRAVSADLGAAARERAIAGAFVRAEQPALVRRRWLAPSALAVAAAALLLFFAHSRPVEPQAWVEGEGTRSFAHASVTLLAGARVRFDAETATLSLPQGGLEVEVDPRPHAPFQVQTARFRAQVLGTSFHVDQRGVSVRHGHVRVVDLRGRQLADLHAGEQYPKAVEPPAPTARNEPAPPKVRPQPKATVRLEPKPSPARTRPTPVVEGVTALAPPSASALLARAREALARDALDDTRQLLDDAERAARERADRAEAGTLRAELALRGRDPAAAVRAYLIVADRYPELPSGENALFAAAQLSPRPTALLERYLAHYPQGRFAAQARARLSSR